MSVTAKQLSKSGARGKEMDSIIREQLHIIDDRLLHAERTWGRNVVNHDLPTNLALPGLNKQDAQRIVYSAIVRSLTKRGFEVALLLEETKSAIYIIWVTDLDTDEIQAMNQLIRNVRITRDKLPGFLANAKLVAADRRGRKTEEAADRARPAAAARYSRGDERAGSLQSAAVAASFPAPRIGGGPAYDLIAATPGCSAKVFIPPGGQCAHDKPHREEDNDDEKEDERHQLKPNLESPGRKRVVAVVIVMRIVAFFRGVSAAGVLAVAGLSPRERLAVHDGNRVARGIHRVREIGARPSTPRAELGGNREGSACWFDELGRKDLGLSSRITSSTAGRSHLALRPGYCIGRPSAYSRCENFSALPRRPAPRIPAHQEVARVTVPGIVVRDHGSVFLPDSSRV